MFETNRRNICNMKKVIIVMFWISSILFLIITRAELSQDHSMDSVNQSKTPGLCNDSVTWRDPFVSREIATWPEALDICNGSFASFDYYDRAPNQTKTFLLRQLNGSSGWLYGLEGISRMNWNFQISSQSCGIRQRVLCKSPSGQGGFSPKNVSAYQGINRICGSASLKGTRATLALIENKSLFWTIFWVGSVDEQRIINDTYQEVNVKCLLLDESGRLRSDECFAKHKGICATEVLKPTVKYVNLTTKIEPYVAPTQEPPNTTAETTGTSTRAVTTTNITRRITSPNVTSPNVTNITMTTMLTDNGVNSEEETQYIIVIGSVSVVLVIVVIGLCCWACRRKAKKSSGEPKLSEVYSDAADSIVIRRASGQVDPGVEYATPDDALTSKKAIPRSSVNSDTYDALNEPLKQKASSKEHVNVYSHVQIVQSDVAAESENTYDVTSYSMNKKSMSQTKDQNETYGSVGVKIS